MAEIAPFDPRAKMRGEHHGGAAASRAARVHILPLAIVDHHSAIVVATGDVEPLGEQKIAENVSPLPAEIARDDQIKFLGRLSRKLKITQDRICRRRRHRRAHIRRIVDPLFDNDPWKCLGDAHLSLVPYEKRPRARDRPLGSRRALRAVFERRAVLPFRRAIVRRGNRAHRLEISRRNGRRREEQPYLDELLLRTPAVAVAECANLTERMCVISRKTVLYSIYNLFNYNEGAGAVIEDNEQLVDEYEDVLGAYLVRISAMEITESDNALVSRMLHTIGDFERISDHAANLLDTSREINEKKIAFSQEAQEELRVLSNAVTEILFLMGAAYEQNDLSAAAHVEPLEQVIDGLIATIKDNHIRRLQNGNCTIELGFVLSDILNNFERISDHCSNIAVAVIDEARGSYDAHKYLNSVKHGDDAAFTESFEGYLTKYTLGA